MAGCDALLVADKVNREVEAEKKDETIEIGAGTTPIANGMSVDIEIRDACETDTGCHSDKVTVTSATASGAFEVVSFEGARVRVHARSTGVGELTVSADVGSESDEATQSLTAEDPDRVELTVVCPPDVTEPYLAPVAGSVEFDYEVYLGATRLLGDGEPPISGDGILYLSATSRRAAYELPDAISTIDVTSAIDRQRFFSLETFDVASAGVSLSLERQLQAGPRAPYPPGAIYHVSSAIGGRRVCVEPEAPKHMRSDAPEICLLWDTVNREESAEVEFEGTEVRLVGKSTAPCPIFAEIVGTGIQLVTTVDVPVY